MKDLFLFSILRIYTTGLLVLCNVFNTTIVLSQEGVNDLEAGMAKIDITPQTPVELAGYGGRKGLSQGIHDRLYARAIVFEMNAKRLVIISTDLIGFYGDTFEYIQKVILDEFKLKPSELFLSAIHTHSGPALTIDQESGHQNNLKYTETLKDSLVYLVGEAFTNKAVIKISAGIGYSPVGANRREMKANGSGWPNEEGLVKLGRNPYGPTDKEVLVMRLTRLDGIPVGALFDYACHATSLGGENYIISGDILGLAEQFVEKILGKDVIASAFAGASGDIDPWYRVLPSFNTEPGWIPESILLGTLLGEEVVHVFRDIKSPFITDEIKTCFNTIDLPGKEKGEIFINGNHPTKSLNVTAARVGDIAFIGFGCEVCTEIGMSIKAASPYRHTFVITHCNGAAGYLPPEHLYKERGYEVTSSEFSSNAAEKVIKKALRMLYDL